MPLLGEQPQPLPTHNPAPDKLVKGGIIQKCQHKGGVFDSYPTQIEPSG